MEARPAHVRRGAQRLVNSAEAGFSVVEALVAVAVLAIAFLPLLALQSQAVRTAAAIERAGVRAEREASALVLLAEINPMHRPKGELDMGGALLIWTSEPVSSRQPMLGPAAGPTRFDLQLYDVAAVIRDPSGRETPLSIRLLGWRARYPRPVPE